MTVKISESPAADGTTVGQLLAESRTLHNEGKYWAKLDKARSRTAFEAARAKRVEAHESDPDHAAQAWADEDRFTGPGKSTHDALMAFYEQVLR